MLYAPLLLKIGEVVGIKILSLLFIVIDLFYVNVDALKKNVVKSN